LTYPLEYIITISALFIVIIYLLISQYLSNKRHEQREDDLMDRLMSRTFSEYAYGSKILSEKPAKSINDELEADPDRVSVE